ncbi:hypothetical protein E4U46_003534 [Claviceps purpurea]|nr:hypothetical protein E4U46_003534 [Claviceps purpurea]
MAMALYAAGFNAWNQLYFGEDSSCSDPEDVFTFTKVLTDNALERPYAGLHYTLVRGQSGHHVAGNGTDLTHHIDTTFVAGNGLTLSVHTDGSQKSKDIQTNGTEPPRGHCVVKYTTYEDCKAGHNPVTLPWTKPIQEVAPYEAGFVVLFQDGTVATLGDARYQECLARDVTTESAADKLEPVPDLMSLGDPIKHVSASGYVLAALTESGSVYIWGRKAPGSHDQYADIFDDLGAIPNYCEIGGGLDVQDFALGDSHAIALTTDGDVYVIGGNRNGQLGVGQCRDFLVREWTHINLGLPASCHVVGVAAGPRSSFIITACK